jgi:hypothetical protein
MFNFLSNNLQELVKHEFFCVAKWQKFTKKKTNVAKVTIN